MLGKMEVPGIVQMEKETTQDKKGLLLWNDYLGDPIMSTVTKTRGRTK